MHSRHTVFRLRDISVRSLRAVELYLKTPNYVPKIPITLDVVTVDDPAFLQLDIQVTHGPRPIQLPTSLCRKDSMKMIHLCPKSCDRLHLAGLMDMCTLKCHYPRICSTQLANSRSYMDKSHTPQKTNYTGFSKGQEGRK